MTNQIDKQLLSQAISSIVTKTALRGLRATALDEEEVATRCQAVCATFDMLSKAIAQGVFDYVPAPEQDTIPAPPPAHDAASEESEHYERDAILYQSPPIEPAYNPDRDCGRTDFAGSGLDTQRGMPESEPSFHGQFFD